VKKIFSSLILTIVLVLTFSILAMAESVLKVGFDFNGTIRETNSSFTLAQYDVNSGITLGYEYVNFDYDTLGWGFGIEFPMERSIATNSAATFNSIPIYAVGYFCSSGETKAFLAIRGGLNILNGNDYFSGGNTLGPGFYCALGGGFYIAKNLRCELAYSLNQGTISNGFVTHDLSYTRLGIQLGYGF
jgi:hypothetical protein